MLKMNQKNIALENNICSSIVQYGRDILDSDVFRKAASETHHLHGNVFRHTINVCVLALRLCYQLEQRGIPVSEKDLIQAALCHDLGMINRDAKYKDRIDSWKCHPKESVRIAKELVPDLSENAQEMILSHMWPVAGSPPSSNEAMLLCIADKYASMEEWKTWLKDCNFVSRIKEYLETEHN